MALAGAAQAVPLQVVVEGVRDARGNVRVAVCSEAEFLRPTCALVAHAPAQAGTTVVRLDVPPGTWAAQAFHDDDNSGKLERTWLGLPTKGLGFSNDAPMRFGPPRWADAAFRLGPEGGRVRVVLHYY